MPTTLATGVGLEAGGFAAGVEAGHLALYRCEQVVDVIALQETFPERLERGALIRGSLRLLRVPAPGQRLQLAFVFLPLALDRLPSRLETRPQRRPIGAGLPAVADLVELLVEGKHFLEQPGRHLRGPGP